jgi:hypothetical protein
MKTFSLTTALCRLYPIVARLHVSDTYTSAFRYVRSRFKPAAWKALSRVDKRTLYIATVRLHLENRALYRNVMRGIV